MVSGCQFGGNKITAENAGADIFCTGKLSINDEMVEAAGYYEMTTGEKIMLPLENLTSIAKLAYFTTAEAEDYFKPINPMPDPDPEPGEGDNSNEEPPIIPPVDNEDNQDSPQMPQQPSESGNDSSDGQSPAVPQTLIEAIVAPTAGLVCGDAVIDTSRSVVLEGYGDGFLHEDDPLTREQLATIIYRLLDEATIEKYGTDISPFADVDSSAWSVQYISTLAKAGIVAGIDNVNYAPSGLVTWAQALAVLSRFVEQQEIPVVNIQYDGWALKAIQTSVANHWIADSVDFNPDMLITRGDLVNVLNRILEQY